MTNPIFNLILFYFPGLLGKQCKYVYMYITTEV